MKAGRGKANSEALVRVSDLETRAVHAGEQASEIQHR
jgi:hypothetical protein